MLSNFQTVLINESQAQPLFWVANNQFECVCCKRRAKYSGFHRDVD